jgi:predicted LPLAT superfamily acyltransferase
MESQILGATRARRIEGIVLRYGLFYGPDNPATQRMIALVRRRMLPVIRGDRGQLPCIHIDDAVAATIAALDRGAAGSSYDIVDDRAVTVDLFGAPARFPAGPWLLAAIARVPVIVAGCFKEGPDTYRLVALPPRHVQFDRARPRDEQIAEWAGAFARDIEGFAVRWPEQWYNFHDVWES